MGGRTGSRSPHWTKKRRVEKYVFELAVSLGADKTDVLSLLRHEKVTQEMMASVATILQEIKHARKTQ